MPQIKSITRNAIPRALAKAERYRLLNEPRDAESICRDILEVEPGNPEATQCLVLALTDQFGHDMKITISHVRELITRLPDDYKRAYYEGVSCERWAKAQLRREAPGHVVYDWFHAAMEAYERAEAVRPEGNDDAVLRWNACCRIVQRNRQIQPKPEQTSHEASFADHLPLE